MARPGLTQHRKFRRLARALDASFVGLGRVLARGYLELLWDSCYESGEEYVGTADDIETLVGWTGESGMLTRALVEAGLPEGVGFLEPVDGTGYRVHDLWHHAPEYVGKRRKRELERQRKEAPLMERRVSDRRTEPSGGQWPPSPSSQAGHGETPSPSPSPSHEPSSDSAEASSALASKPFLVFPTSGPVNAWTLTEGQVARWAELYPAVDIRAEARKALAWVEANRSRRKTAVGMPRFFVAWLGRANDRGGQPPRVPDRQDVAVVSHAWVCPHEPRCNARHQCHVKQQIEAHKRQAAS